MPSSNNSSDEIEEIARESENLAENAEEVLDMFRGWMDKAPKLEDRSLREEVELAGDQKLTESMFKHLDNGNFDQAENEFFSIAGHTKQDYETFVKNYLFVRIVESVVTLRSAESDLQGLDRVVMNALERGEATRHDLLRIGGLIIDLEESGVEPAKRDAAEAERVMEHYQFKIEEPENVDGYLQEVNEELSGIHPETVIENIVKLKNETDKVFERTEKLLGMNKEEIKARYKKES